MGRTCTVLAISSLLRERAAPPSRGPATVDPAEREPIQAATVNLCGNGMSRRDIAERADTEFVPVCGVRISF